MAIRSLGLAATLALSANAFLLPPDLSTTDIKSDSDLSTWTLVDPSSQVLLVPCDGCKTAASDENNLVRLPSNRDKAATWIADRLLSS